MKKDAWIWAAVPVAVAVAMLTFVKVPHAYDALPLQVRVPVELVTLTYNKLVPAAKATNNPAAWAGYNTTGLAEIKGTELGQQLGLDDINVGGK